VNAFFDALETRDPTAREAALMAALPAQVLAAQATAAFGDRLAGIDAVAIASRAALAALPVTRKSQLLERQRASVATDPFGGFSALGWRALPRPRRAQRVYQSPGPIYEPESAARDYWRLARALFAAGLREGDLAHNCFSTTSHPAA
jgi:phenylacetate-CoA ligase